MTLRIVPSPNAPDDKLLGQGSDAPVRMRERRKHPRLVTSVEGRWIRASGGAAPYLAGDISMGGCFFHADEAPAVGERVSLVLQANHDAPAVVLNGTVVDVTTDPMSRSDWSSGIALQFEVSSGLEQGQLAELLRVLRSRSRRFRRPPPRVRTAAFLPQPASSSSGRKDRILVGSEIAPSVAVGGEDASVAVWLHGTRASSSTWK